MVMVWKLRLVLFKTQALIFHSNTVAKIDQVVIAQWLARRLATGEVPGSNPGKGDNLINF